MLYVLLSFVMATFTKRWATLNKTGLDQFEKLRKNVWLFTVEKDQHFIFLSTKSKTLGMQRPSGISIAEGKNQTVLKT